MANILAIGIATIDIINTVETYPDEDNEVRALKQHQSRGGNATNTLTILSQLGHQCTWGGVLIDESDSKLIKDDLNRYDIDFSTCKSLSNGKMPTSYITLNQKNGSRTIVHYRDCPEFNFDDFNKIDLTQFDWIHFEGRNIEQTRLMLQYLKLHHPELPCSLEIEKPRPDIEQLFDIPNILMFSQHYAQSHNFSNATSLLSSLPSNTIASCAWGKDGAWAIAQQGQMIHSNAFPPEDLVDTLGAGDTFNAGLIHGLINQQVLQDALSFACQLAGYKCGQTGFDLSNHPFEL